MSTTAALATRADPFVGYGKALGVLLLGYLLLDRAFAYLHLPGLPPFIGDMVLLLGLWTAVRSPGTLRRSVAAEPVLALLAVLIAWGAWRTLPGLAPYGLHAPRDAALWYYALFAFLAVAAVAARPDLPMTMADRLARWAPVVLVWLAARLLLTSFGDQAPAVPFTDVSVLSHKPGGAATAALLVLVVLWLVPRQERRRGRVAWSLLALAVIALVTTQNRGALLGVLAGGVVALPFLARRWRVVGWTLATTGTALVLMLLLSVRVPFPGPQGREYSAEQLVTNVVSLTGAKTSGNLQGTTQGRMELWTRVLNRQVSERRVLLGAGFGPNLAAEVGVLDEGTDSLRNPHNSHLSVLTRMGVVGGLVWAGFWVAWYWRMAGACRRLRHSSRHADAQLGAVSLVVVTSVLVSSVFDPQLEGPQAAVVLWSLVGMGLAVTGRRR